MATPLDVQTCLGRQRIEGEEEEEPDRMINGNPLDVRTCLGRQRIEGGEEEEEPEEGPDSMIIGKPIGCTNLPRKAENQGRRRRRARQHDKWQSHWMYEPA